MIAESKAVKKQCVGDFVHTLKLTATTAEEARFLSIAFRAVACGGSVAVKDSVTGRKATFTHEPKAKG